MRRDLPQRIRPVSRGLGNFDRAPSRAKLYAFILSMPTFPTHEQICDHMGWRNLASVSGALTILYEAGYLHRRLIDMMFVYTIPPAGRADFEKWQREQKGVRYVEHIIR